MGREADLLAHPTRVGTRVSPGIAPLETEAFLLPGNTSFHPGMTLEHSQGGGVRERPPA